MQHTKLQLPAVQNQQGKIRGVKMFAAGMDYAQHNRELLETLLRPENPVIFMKPNLALPKGHKPFLILDDSERIEYEAEVVVRIYQLGKIISERFTHRYYDAATLGIDFIARELQQKLRAAGQPWGLSKGFDGTAMLGDWMDVDKFRGVQALNFHPDANGQTMQEGLADDMLYKADELITYISRYFTLKTGDILYTGIPAGTGPMEVNNHLGGYLTDRRVLGMNRK